MSETGGWARLVESLSGRVDRSFGAIERSLDLPAAVRIVRLTPTSWTIREIAEHVTRTNQFLLLLVEKIGDKVRRRLARAGEPVEAPALPRFDRLDLLADRRFRWDSPDHMRPTGSVDDRTIRASLAEQRGRAARALREFPRGEGTLHTIRMSVVGPDARLDLYEFVYVIALHAERHAAQIERVRRAADQS